MPIAGRGWELHVVRYGEQARGDGRRTLGTYRAYWQGQPLARLQGCTVEAVGPGDNGREGNGLRIEAGAYPLGVNISDSYRTLGFDPQAGPDSRLKPCIGVQQTGARTFILIHPGWGFSASVGCLQPVGQLADAEADIDFADSRERVLRLLADLAGRLGPLPPRHGETIAGRPALIVDGEP